MRAALRSKNAKRRWRSRPLSTVLAVADEPLFPGRGGQSNVEILSQDFFTPNAGSRG